MLTHVMKSLRIIPAALLLAPAAAMADSYVFITNSTPDPVRIEVKHTFSDKPMVQGDQWAQEATEIAPYQTKRVLRYNRNVGVKSGKSYRFDTRVIAGSSVLVAEQKMTGTWSGSNIQQSATGPDFSAAWFTDRDIHRDQTKYQLRPSTSAFKAKFTGGYDDFYYTISNNPVPEAATGSDSFKALAYNIFALPLIASDISTRVHELPSYLKGYDVLMLSEAFSSDVPDMLRKLSLEYPYQTEVLRKPYDGINIFNGGVVVLSRHPIARVEYKVYDDCTGTDCFADKGYVYAEVIKGGKAYHVTGTHTASFDTDDARALRQIQFRDMRANVQNMNIPANEAVLYGGDMNVNKLIFADTDYVAMQTNLNASVPVSTGYTKSTFDPEVNHYASDAVEYLDYVLWSNEHRQPVQSRNDVRVPRSVSSDLWEKWDLSDHFAVMGEFVFE